MIFINSDNFSAVFSSFSSRKFFIFILIYSITAVSDKKIHLVCKIRKNIKKRLYIQFLFVNTEKKEIIYTNLFDSDSHYSIMMKKHIHTKITNRARFCIYYYDTLLFMSKIIHNLYFQFNPCRWKYSIIVNHNIFPDAVVFLTIFLLFIKIYLQSPRHQEINNSYYNRNHNADFKYQFCLPAVVHNHNPEQ